MNNQEAPLEPKIYRVIDANINRLKEGIRVVEDVVRYVYDNKELALRLKNLRHQVIYNNPKLLEYRDIDNDVLRQSTQSEMQRENLEAVVKANIQRAQEAARVLEEIMKIADPALSSLFKKIRYELYAIEKLLLTPQK